MYTWAISFAHTQRLASFSMPPSEPESSPMSSATTAGRVYCLQRNVGGCQNYGPFLDPYYSTAPNIWGTQKWTIILTTAHVTSWQSDSSIGYVKSVELHSLSGKAIERAKALGVWFPDPNVKLMDLEMGYNLDSIIPLNNPMLPYITPFEEFGL